MARAAQRKDPNRSLRVLILEDSPADAELVLHALRRAHYQLAHNLAETPETFQHRLRENTYDVILADYNLGPWTGMDALEILHQSGRDIPFILVTAALGEEAAVECIKQGVADYVLKDRLARLPVAVEQALAARRLRRQRCRAEQDLRKAHEELEHRLRELEQERAKLRTLSRRLVHVQEEERRRLGRELHDQVGQLLTAIRLNLALFEQSLSEPQPADRLQDALGLTDQCLEHIRNLSYLLRPPLLEEAGLLSAIRWFIERYTRHTGIRVETQLPETLPRLPHEMEMALFRVLQESLTNVGRHAHATAARVELNLADHFLRLLVADQGRGFDIEQTLRSSGAGVGLLGIQERVRELGGELAIDSAPGRGTQLRVSLPLPVSVP
ncbi:MAG: response regulator [Terriglobia bacterium]